MVKNRPGSRVGQTKLGTASRKAARRQAARQKNGLANKRTIVHEAMRETWDRRQSPTGNLSRVGLCPSVNTLRKSRVAVGRVVEIASVPAPRDSEVLQRLVEEAGLPEKRPKRVVKPGEKLALEKLVRKHGRDWGKMATDLKLNYLQWTPTQLRKKVERMEAILAETG